MTSHRTPDKTRVVLVDDNAANLHEHEVLVRHSRTLECVGAFNNCPEFLRRVKQLHPDVVVMDLHMPGISGAECTCQVRKLLPDVKIIMIGPGSGALTVADALVAGADGCLMSSCDARKFSDSISEVAEGSGAFCSDAARELVQHFRTQCQSVPFEDLLTHPESEVLKLLATGRRYKEIADQLGISAETVKTHAVHLYKKLGVSSRTEAVLKLL